MKNFLMASVMAGTGLLVTQVASANLTIDHFDFEAQSITRSSVGTSTGTSGSNVNILGNYRTLQLQVTTAGDPGLQSRLIVSTVSSKLFYSNDTGYDSIMMVTWDGNGAGIAPTANFAAAGDRIEVAVLSADLPGSIAKMKLIDSLNNSFTVTLPALPAGPQNLQFMLSSFTGVDTTSVKSVEFIVDGVAEYDASYDIVGVVTGVPEPVTAGLSLLSLGALGLFATKRRQA